MADLLAILSQASASLAAHRGAATTHGHNLQNANTPGYARQRGQLSAVIPAQLLGGQWVGRGVALGSITQMRDRFLESQIPRALGSSGFANAEAESLKGTAVLDPSAKGGVPEMLGEFYAQLRQLAQNPSSPGLRQGVVAAASALTRAFNRTANGIDGARAALDSKVEDLIIEANGAARSMAELNRQIRIATASGGAPNDLLDARIKVRDELAQLTGAQAVVDAEGNISMVLPGGLTIVSQDRASELETLPDPALGGALALRLRASDTSVQNLLADDVGGRIGGVTSARDGALWRAGQQLDTLAFDLAAAVNTIHRAGFAANGTTGLDLFTTGTTASGAARLLDVNAAIKADPSLIATASTAGSPGDSTNVLSLVGSERQVLSGGLVVADAMAGLITQYGAEASRADAEAELDGGVLAHLEALRESTSGVSIDEEVIELSKAQRAYEAVMKVIQTADEMLDTLLKLR